MFAGYEGLEQIGVPVIDQVPLLRDRLDGQIDQLETFGPLRIRGQLKLIALRGGDFEIHPDPLGDGYLRLAYLQGDF